MVNTVNVLNSRAKEISDNILFNKEKLALQRFDFDSNLYTNDIADQIKTWREKLIDIYAMSINQEQKKVYEILQAWGNETVDLLVNLNLPLDLAIEEVRFYRDTIGEIIKDTAKEFSMSIDDFYTILSNLDSVIDRAIHWLSISYSRSYSARVTIAETTAHDLSIPIVRITSEIGVIPLIGVLDTQRATHLMSQALDMGSKLNLNYMVIDLSGVPVIDTMVAQQIFRVIESLRLIGIETRLSGIRPEIAQTMVKLNIKLNEKTSSSLHLAIKDLL
ncbi:STAS domain-containing protein [Peribacillus sp. SI8-4]|uniref:STAS domain-containing protein n=1 Tax=Peribacillus sp. SI8-4 TaxID=3048009 RepID=UPI002554D8AE|nr:STAS domain-containing protein [Peribacillus sp. SI8-4]